MTTLELEIALMKHINIRQNLIVLNVTDMSRTPVNFETDILSLSNSNYATGIELKISKADLKNDIKKRHIINIDKLNYKSYLKTFFYGLKYFYYAVPEELEEETLKQIPEYFGLYVCKFNILKEKYYIEEKRKPKPLFNYKWNDNERYELARLGSMRILNLKQKISYLKNFQVIAYVKYELSKDTGIISILCDNEESDKSVISRAQKLFRSRTNIIHYGEQIWTIIYRELLKF